MTRGEVSKRCASFWNGVVVLGRNVVPVFGVLFLDWSPAKLLLVYFADTLLTMAALFAIVSCKIVQDEPRGYGLLHRAGLVVFATVFLTGTMAFPLGIPLVFYLAGTLTFDEFLADRELHYALLAQLAFALGLFVQTYLTVWGQPEMKRHTKERFGFVFVRWFILIAASMPIAGIGTRWFVGLLLIALYAVTTIYRELAPEKVLRLFGVKGGLSGEDPEPREPKRNGRGGR